MQVMPQKKIILQFGHFFHFCCGVAPSVHLFDTSMFFMQTATGNFG